MTDKIKDKPAALTVIDGGKDVPANVEPGQLPDGQKGPDKLTNKQRAFVNAMLKGAGSQSAAYRIAYDAANMSEAAVHVEACKLMHHPKISQRLAEGFKAQEANATHSAASLRLHLEKTFYDMSVNAETESARLRAAELLGKSEKVGFFMDRSEVATSSTLTERELTEQLELELKQAFGQ